MIILKLETGFFLVTQCIYMQKPGFFREKMPEDNPLGKEFISDKEL